jgi:hypothetical protein
MKIEKLSVAEWEFEAFQTQVEVYNRNNNFN